MQELLNLGDAPKRESSNVVFDTGWYAIGGEKPEPKRIANWNEIAPCAERPDQLDQEQAAHIRGLLGKW